MKRHKFIEWIKNLSPRKIKNTWCEDFSVNDITYLHIKVSYHYLGLFLLLAATFGSIFDRDIIYVVVSLIVIYFLIPVMIARSDKKKDEEKIAEGEKAVSNKEKTLFICHTRYVLIKNITDENFKKIPNPTKLHDILTAETKATENKQYPRDYISRQTMINLLKDKKVRKSLEDLLDFPD